MATQLPQQDMWQALPNNYLPIRPPTQATTSIASVPEPQEINQDWVAVDVMLVFIFICILMLPTIPEE